MTLGMLFVGCVAVLGMYVAVVWYYRTALFGLSTLKIFVIGSASVAGFFVTGFFDEPYTWVTQSHVVVFEYTLAGLAAMIAGLFLAWRPLKRTSAPAGMIQPIKETHLNEELGWITFL